MTDVLFLIVSLFLILLSAEIFTNGVELLGRKLSLSQAVVGSILAAVGTALPETILPFVAILMHGGDAARQIGVGAILGAPFMLSTLAFFLVGISVVVTFLRKKRAFELRIEVHSMKRDLLFFLLLYSAAIFLPLLIKGANIYIAGCLFVGYIVYAFMTFRGESADIMHTEELYFRRIWFAVSGLLKGPSGAPRLMQGGGEASLALIVVQVLSALALMIGGAHTFVGSLAHLSASWGMNPMLFALLIAPVATELPEKFNSVTWTLKGRDTLAMGNITGAMVFQSTFPVAVGLLFTDWEMSRLALLSAILSLLSAAIVVLNLFVANRVSPFAVLFGGVFYIMYAAAILFGM